MKTIFVSKTGTITTLKEALSLINNEPTTILLDEGVYFEKVSVLNNHIIIKGKSKENTIISFNDFSKKINDDGQELNTFRTYTVELLGNNITLENLTIENTSGDGKKYGQAVALQAVGDMIVVKNCNIKGYQDTLFVGPLPFDLINRYQGFIKDRMLAVNYQTRQFFTNCIIEGDVDFIFGSGNTIFNRCEIRRISSLRNVAGFDAAPSTDESSKYGFTFINCDFTSDINCQYYIARPWRDYGKVSLINCNLSESVASGRFNGWEKTNRDKTCRFEEIGSTGLGSSNSIHKWINTNIDINDYTINKIFKDWNPINE